MFFEPRSRVRVVLKRTVVVDWRFDNLKRTWAVVIFSNCVGETGTKRKNKHRGWRHNKPSLRSISSLWKFFHGFYYVRVGVLPYIGNIGSMCGPKGIRFSAVLVKNRVSFLTDFGHFSDKIWQELIVFVLLPRFKKNPLFHWKENQQKPFTNYVYGNLTFGLKYRELILTQPAGLKQDFDVRAWDPFLEAPR